ncbi:MAG: hypothetical protein AABX47_07050 [Nanoarchaeota archaeon]
MILTKNEKRVLRFLAASVGKTQSMNEIGKGCGVTSGGAFKILTKLEKEGVVQATPIANLKAYKLDFDGENTESVLHIAFVPEKLEGRLKLRAQDLRPLKDCTKICAIFGSYTTTNPNPNDLDIMLVLEKKDFSAYKHALKKAKDIIPIKIQDIVQTTEDLEENLRKGDPVISEIVSSGIVLWGFDALVQVIKNASR